MYGIFTYMWQIYMVNVGKYAIHGCFGIWHHWEIWDSVRLQKFYQAKNLRLTLSWRITPFISHEKAIWKRNNPILRGRKLTIAWLLNTKINWDDPPSTPDLDQEPLNPARFWDKTLDTNAWIPITRVVLKGYRLQVHIYIYIYTWYTPWKFFVTFLGILKWPFQWLLVTIKRHQHWTTWTERPSRLAAIGDDSLRIQMCSTVDGRNPAPLNMWVIPLFTWFCRS